MIKLYKYELCCGRMGVVRGVFAATEEEVKEAIGEDVYFGEILGKHSEIFGELKEDQLTVLTEDQDFIAKATEYKLIPHGYSPLDYLHEDGYGDEDDDEAES